MKKMRFKKLSFILVFAIMLSVFSATSLTASANDLWSSGQEYYTPYTGSMGAHETYVCAYNLKWNLWQKTMLTWQQANYSYDLSVEFEFRPITWANEPVSPYTYWCFSMDFSSNLPSAAYEFDNDDITICSHHVTNITAEASYWGYYNVPPKPDADWYNKPIVLECELGYYVPIVGDSYPIDYETFNGISGTETKLIGTTYSW